MRFISHESLRRFLDVSVIIPLQQNFEYFLDTIARNQKYFQQNGVEIIIVVDESSVEKKLIQHLYEYPLLNWKVVINRNANNYYNWPTAINVGVRQARHKYIFQLDPDIELHSDVIYQLRYIMENYPGSFAVSKVITAQDSSFAIDYGSSDHLEYACLMVEKKNIEQINGYDEEITDRSLANFDVCSRLALLGIKRMVVNQSQLISRNNFVGKVHASPTNESFHSSEQWQKAYCPKRYITNNHQWGNSFNDICFHWKNDKSERFRKQLLSSFDNVYFSSDEIYNQKFSVICLMQVRNEQKHIPEVLNHLSQYCDGIILLDDGSDDDSYELAQSEALLLKVKKKYKGYFDDLENRNLLLQLGHLFKADWFLFMDADERFDERYADIAALTKNESYDTILFRLVHLWNDKSWYRKDVPNSLNGIILRYRMFRNMGYQQIIASRELHFAVTPFIRNDNKSDNQILILHYGLMHQETRKRKYDSYSIQDKGGKKQGHGYDYLLDTKPQLVHVKELKI